MIEEIIAKRRSVFPDQYIEKPIPKDLIERLLEAANTAPTHKRTEPWRFKVIQGDSQNKLGEFLAAKYQELDPKPKKFKTEKLRVNPTKAGALIAICMQRDPQESLPEWEEVAATAMAVQNMYLCCAAWDLGCYWSSPGLIKYMGEFFELEPGERCLGFLYLGYYEGELNPIERKPVADKTTWL